MYEAYPCALSCDSILNQDPELHKTSTACTALDFYRFLLNYNPWWTPMLHNTQTFLPIPSWISVFLFSLHRSCSPTYLSLRSSGRWTQSCFHCWSCKGSLTARGGYGEAIPPNCTPLRPHCRNNQNNRLG